MERFKKFCNPPLPFSTNKIFSPLSVWNFLHPQTFSSLWSEGPFDFSIICESDLQNLDDISQSAPFCVKEIEKRESSARKHFKYSGERKIDSIKANRKPVVEKGLTRPGSSISNLDAPSIVTSFSFSREPLLADAGFKIHDTNNTFNTWPVAASSFTMSSSDTTSLVFTEAWRRTCRLSQLSKIIEVNTISKLLIKKKKKNWIDFERKCNLYFFVELYNDQWLLFKRRIFFVIITKKNEEIR